MRRSWITFLRVVRYGLNNFTRNAWLTTAATAVMTITLLIVLTTFTARMIFSDTIYEIRQKLEVSVFFKDDIEQSEVNRFAKELAQVPIVTSVQYISKEQARQSFSEQNKEELAQLEALGELEKNPFPASLRIRTSDPNKLDAVNSVINKPENQVLQSEQSSTSVQRRDAINTIARVSQFTDVAGLATGAIFVIISVMIIFNTIRMAIFNRRDEIEIMKLIGAEKRFIRGPFLVEAALYGVLAAVISLALLYTVLFTRASDLASYEIVVQPTLDLFKQWPVVIALGQLVVGIIIGIFSALLAMRRYLRV